jgi:hypothetical protein
VVEEEPRASVKASVELVRDRNVTCLCYALAWETGAKIYKRLQVMRTKFPNKEGEAQQENLERGIY